MVVLIACNILDTLQMCTFLQSLPKAANVVNRTSVAIRPLVLAEHHSDDNRSVLDITV